MKNIVLSLSFLALLISTPAFAGGSAVANVDGLVCDFCAQALKKVFAKEPRVDGIDVDLDDKTVTINFKDDENLTDAEIEDLISRGGYDISGISRPE